MRYESASSIKGFVALIVIGVGSLYGISAQGAGHTLEDQVVAGLMLFVGICIGLSWMRSRKRIRQMARHAQLLRKSLNRMGLQTKTVSPDRG
jgi:preprotein translocase subunit SecG